MRKFFISCLILFGCHQQDITKKQDPIDYSQIGSEYNKGLDYIFGALKNAKQSSSGGRISIANYLSIVGSSGKDFVLKTYPELSDQSKNLFDQYANKANSGLTLAYTRVSRDSSVYQQLIDSANVFLTSKQKMYIISTMLTGDLNAINNSLQNIEQSVRANCSDNELPTILASIAIARSSAKYWNDNYQTWVNEFGSPQNGRAETAVNWGAVGAVDVAEGVAVAGGLWWTGAIPGIGWTAFGVITGGMSLLASGGTALVYAAS